MNSKILAMAFSAVLLFSVVSIAIPIPSAEAGKATSITINGGHPCKLIGGTRWDRIASQCYISGTKTIDKNFNIPAGVTVFFESGSKVTIGQITISIQSGEIGRAHV